MTPSNESISKAPPTKTWSHEGDVNTTSARERWHSESISAQTRSRLAEDEKYFLHQSLSTPCLNLLAEAEGSYVQDVEGRRYLDFHGNNVHQIGFRHPHVVAAVTQQLGTLPFCTRRYTNEVAISFARKLIEVAPPGLTRVLFAPAGTVAMSMALKLARLATGKFKTISMWDAFHGATLDSISVGGETQFRQGVGPLLPGTEHVPPCEIRACPFKCGASCSLACADYIDYVLEREGDVAAVIGETIRCTPSIPPLDYWKKVRAACDKHGALLILDEIPIGLGRSGKLFALEHYGVVPDLLVLGKGLGGGIMPLAAVLATERFNVVGPSSIGHFTHEKNPMACAAGLATLEVIEQEGLVENARTLGLRALSEFSKFPSRHRLVGALRGLGLLMGIELMHDGDPLRPAREEATEVMYAALRRGLNFKLTRGNMLTLTPPISLSDAELSEAIGILDDALTEVEQR
jgi:4-aminobutyrate aminotransferase